MGFPEHIAVMDSKIIGVECSRTNLGKGTIANYSSGDQVDEVAPGLKLVSDA